MTLGEFLEKHPHYGFDFATTLQSQARIYDLDELASLPEELFPPDRRRTRGGRSRALPNQTRTHYQCRVCLRVLRNDLFYTPPKLKTKNRIFGSCIACTRSVNAQRYLRRTDEMRDLHLAVWTYIAPRCQLCGFDKHSSAIDLHHMSQTDGRMSELVALFAQTPTTRNGERLLREARRSLALCANCHRMLHAGAITVPANVLPVHYHLSDLMSMARRHAPPS